MVTKGKINIISSFPAIFLISLKTTFAETMNSNSFEVLDSKVPIPKTQYTISPSGGNENGFSGYLANLGEGQRFLLGFIGAFLIIICLLYFFRRKKGNWGQKHWHRYFLIFLIISTPLLTFAEATPPEANSKLNVEITENPNIQAVNVINVDYGTVEMNGMENEVLYNENPLNISLHKFQNYKQDFSLNVKMDGVLNAKGETIDGVNLQFLGQNIGIQSPDKNTQTMNLSAFGTASLSVGETKTLTSGDCTTQGDYMVTWPKDNILVSFNKQLDIGKYTFLLHWEVVDLA